MAADERDQQADALSKLAKGEGVEPDMPISSGTVNLSNNLDLPPALLNPTQPAPTEKKPSTVRPPSPVTANKRVQSAPLPPSRVPAPTLPASEAQTSDRRQRTAAPAQPAAPRERPAAPPRQEPVPQPVQSVIVPGDLSSALAHIVEDSDAVSAPAPDPSVLVRTRPRSKEKQKSFFATLQFRQTIIPILLVLGVSLPLLSVGWLMLDKDSLLRIAGPALPIALACVGLVMLGLAIVNMLAVRHELRSMR